jgi:hypothetical protein
MHSKNSKMEPSFLDSAQLLVIAFQAMGLR